MSESALGAKDKMRHRKMLVPMLQLQKLTVHGRDRHKRGDDNDNSPEPQLPLHEILASVLGIPVLVFMH